MPDKKHTRDKNTGITKDISDINLQESGLEAETVLSLLSNGDTVKPKKHKKKKHKTSTTGTYLCDKTQEICESKEKMKEKFDSEKYKDSVVSSVLNSDNVKPKKQKKKQKASDISCEETEAVGDRKRKTKKLEFEKCTNSIEQTVSEVNPCVFPDSETGKPKKHKKKKHKTVDADITNASPVNSEEKRDKKRLNSESGDNHETTVDMPKQRKRKKHKHQVTDNNMKSKYCKQDEQDAEDTTEINQNVCEVSTENSKRGKKRKKHSKDRDESFEYFIAPESEPKSKRVKKSKKRSNASDMETNQEVLVSQELLDESTKAKKKKKIKHKDAADDFSLMASPAENMIPVHKEKSKHKGNNLLNELSEISSVEPALVEQTERTHCSSESSASNNVNTCTSIIQGQWQGSMFESADRQAKFLRLLGGMKKPNSDGDKDGGPKKGLFSSQNSTRKKGLFGSFTSMTSGGNAALSVSDATSLDQKLEEEYNKAMNFRLSGKKGAGFGFTSDPAEGKKFHIDVNKSKSIKFDD